LSRSSLSTTEKARSVGANIVYTLLPATEESLTLRESMKMTPFWDIAPCSLVEVGRRFRGAYCLQYCPDVRRTSETSVNFNETTWPYIPNSCHLQSLACCRFSSASSKFRQYFKQTRHEDNATVTYVYFLNKCLQIYLFATYYIIFYKCCCYS
jgi:hypothetical protein